MNADPILIQFVLGGALVVFGVIVLIISARTIRSGGKNKRLDDFVFDPDRSSPNPANKKARLVPRELSGSLISRTIQPTIKKWVTFLGKFTPQNSILQLDHQLGIARNPYNLTASSFYGIRIFMLIAGLGTAAILNINNTSMNILFILGGLLIIGLFLLLPVIWLRSKMNSAQEIIRRGLPDVLDMLSVCTSAGLGFDQAMQKVGDYWQTSLSTEFRRVLQEMEMGLSRADALRNMVNRVEVSELSSFVAVIIQAETLGMAIADVLHEQSDQMRDQRMLRAKQIANTLPVKMLPPLAFLILPALLAVILGPSLITILNLFITF